jgi:hypothetical protein
MFGDDIVVGEMCCKFGMGLDSWNNNKIHLEQR